MEEVVIKVLPKQKYDLATANMGVAGIVAKHMGAFAARGDLLMFTTYMGDSCTDDAEEFKIVFLFKEHQWLYPFSFMHESAARNRLMVFATEDWPSLIGALHQCEALEI
jgi:hypothetical protein